MSRVASSHQWVILRIDESESDSSGNLRHDVRVVTLDAVGSAYGPSCFVFRGSGRDLVRVDRLGGSRARVVGIASDVGLVRKRVTQRGSHEGRVAERWASTRD